MILRNFVIRIYKEEEEEEMLVICYGGNWWSWLENIGWWCYY